VLAVVMVGFGTVLAMARQPGVHSWRTIWQEDGAIFLNHAWKDPFLDTLGQVYNSYLHTVPRLLAGVVALFPLDRAALGLTLSACLVISALGLYIYYASAAIYTSPWSRFLLAAMIVLLPAGGYETNAAISDLHWYFLYAAFWALLANPKDRRGIVIGSLVCLGAVLSDPLTGLIMPLVIQRAWSAWRAGERMRLVMPILFTAGLALQVVLGSVSAPTGRDAQSHFADLPGIYALRVAGSTLVGDQWLGTFWLPLGYAFAYGALAIVLGLVLYAFLKARGERRWFVLGSFVFSVLILCVPLMLRGTQFFLDRSIYSLNGSRYTVVPVMFLMGILVLLLDQRDRRLSPTAWRHVQMAGGAFLAGLIVTSFSVVTVRSAGPDWPGQVMKARRQCAEMAKGAPLPDLNALPPAPGDPPTPPTELRIPVSPNIPDSSQPFAVTLSCDKDLR
jgi:hypothetical protein